MPSLAEVTAQAEELAPDERVSLLAHLIETLPNPPAAADDDEVARREAEIDDGTVALVPHVEFVKFVKS
jgi:hypothetical protein